MISKYRDQFNSSFSEEKYNSLLKILESGLTSIPFRVAETPVFIPSDLQKKLIDAGEEIINLIKQPDFKALTKDAIPSNWNVPNENEHPHFLTFDFGICKDANGLLTPKLIEMQGFPSLYGFQPELGRVYKELYELPAALTPFLMDLMNRVTSACLKG